VTSQDHNGQHATCPKCGTDQAFTISGNLAGHDPAGDRVTRLNGRCAGSGMTRRQIDRAAKETRS
jgi:hypothetical protein